MLARKKGLRRTGGLRASVGLKTGGGLKSSGFKAGATKPLKQTRLAQVSKKKAAESPALKPCPVKIKSLKSCPVKKDGSAVKPRKNKRSGMKGIPVSHAEAVYHGRLAELGCVACWLDRHPSPPVSIHHCKGRTKKGAHLWVLPLCAGHHQDGTGIPGLIARHPWKARFEGAYGSEQELMVRCIKLIVAEDGGADAIPEALHHLMVAHE